MDKKKKRALFLLAVLIVVSGGVLFLTNYHDCGTCKLSYEGDDNVPEATGREWADIYHAGDGLWRVFDEAIHVLKERKYVSGERERDLFLVKKMESGGVLRIVEAKGRWKLVEVVEDGEVAAKGWIDAHWIKKAERIGD